VCSWIKLATGLTFEGDYLFFRMHNCRICSDRSSNNIIGIRKVDDNDLVLFPNLFANAYKMIRLEGQGLEHQRVSFHRFILSQNIDKPGSRLRQVARRGRRVGGARRMQWVLRYQPRVSGIMSSFLCSPRRFAHHSRRPAKGYVSSVNKISSVNSLPPLPMDNSPTIISENTMNILD
jgi:hypothetical protein